MTYLILKLIHIASVVVFVGNITTGVFWGMRAHRSRDFRLIASTFDGISQSDRWFTIPGVIGVLVSGIAAAMVGNMPILGTGWILWGIVLFVIAGIVDGRFLSPLQRDIAGLARTADSNPATWTAYEKLYRGWAVWGILALLAPVGALIVMVLKPALPAF